MQGCRTAFVLTSPLWSIMKAVKSLYVTLRVACGRLADQVHILIHAYTRAHTCVYTYMGIRDAPRLRMGGSTFTMAGGSSQFDPVEPARFFELARSDRAGTGLCQLDLGRAGSTC